MYVSTIEHSVVLSQNRYEGDLNMGKRLISLLLCLSIIFSLGTTASAASEGATASAQKLYELGLFNGTGKDASGNPIFDLDLIPSRNQAVTMLVRLLGKAEEAESKQWTTPFTDEAEWAKPYVGYAYANGLTAGTSATTYSGNLNTTVVQYLTFILRALGYQSGVDFEYSKAWEFADTIGLTDGRYNANTTDFRRSDIAEISYDALYVFKKGTTKMLGEVLASEGVISLTKFLEASPSPFAIKGGVKCYSRYPAVLSFENICPATKFWQEYEIDYCRLGIPYNFNYSYTMSDLAEAESYAQKYSDFLISNGYVLVKAGDNTITEDRDITYELVSENGDYGVEIASSAFGSCTVNVAITPPSSFNPDADSDSTINPVNPGQPPDSVDVRMYDRYKDVPDFASVSTGDLLYDDGPAKVYASSHLNNYISTLGEHGYRKDSTYTEKYENSQLLTQNGSVSIYKNSAGREVHVLEVNDSKIGTTFAFVSIDSEIKKPLIAEAISEVVAQKNPYEDSSCQYKNDGNNYKYGHTDTTYGSPIYVRKEKVDSINSLQTFLNLKYKQIFSPMEDFDVDVEIWDNSSSSSGRVFNIHVEFSYVSPDYEVITPYNFASMYGYTESEKEETRDMIKEMLYEISQDAIDCFPDAAVSGSIYVSGYHYPHIKVDYYSDQTLTWNRTANDFKWVPSLDTFSLYE